MRKLRLSEVVTTQGHSTSIWQSWALGPGPQYVNPLVFPPSLLVRQVRTGGRQAGVG